MTAPRAKLSAQGRDGRTLPSCLPLTVSRPSLLEDGSDRRFRQLIYDLLTISVRMEAVREHLARRMGISAPQYSVLVAIAQLQCETGVSVRKRKGGTVTVHDPDAVAKKT